jgi:hypothetical protein
MASWSDITEACARRPHDPRVKVRRAGGHGVEWVHVLVELGWLTDLSLEELLRRSARASLGAVVVEGERAWLREGVRLDGFAAEDLHRLIEIVVAHGRALVPARVPCNVPHPCGELFA